MLKIKEIRRLKKAFKALKRKNKIFKISLVSVAKNEMVIVAWNKELKMENKNFLIDFEKEECKCL